MRVRAARWCALARTATTPTTLSYLEVARRSALSQHDWPGLAHLFVASNASDGLYVWLKLFVGPDLDLPAFIVQLSSTRLDVGVQLVGHAAIYLEPTEEHGDGKIVRLQISTTR